MEGSFYICYPLEGIILGTQTTLAIEPQVKEPQIKLRPLVSYALSSYSVAHGGDYFTALAPLFAPIAAEMNGQLFEPKGFCKKLENIYGICAHEYVATNFIAPMVAAGLLEETSNSPSHKTYRYTFSLSEPFEDEYKKFEEKLNAVFAEYHKFVNKMDSLTNGLYSKEELESGLIDWLLRTDDRLSFASPGKKKPKSELDFIASRFLQNLEQEKPDFFDDLSLIHSGVVISELVLDFKTPETSKRKVRDLNIFLDAPFVMHLLKLSGNQNFESTNNIFKQLKRLEVQLHIFKHSCEEIEGNIDAVLSPTNPEKRGPLATALTSREVMVDYVRAVRNNLNEHIENLGIKVFDPLAYGAQQNREKYFSQDQWDRLYDTIPWGHDKAQAKERDAMSISTIVRWRAGKKVRDFLKSKYLFVTNNNKLAFKAREFCINEDVYNLSHAPPAISVQKLSGILFLTLGDAEERLSLSRKQLLASCGRAAIASPGIIEAFNNKLKELAPGDAEQIATILSEPRTVQLAMDLTWGNPETVTRDNIEDVIENLKDDLVSEQTKKHKDKIKTVSAERDAVANDNAQLRAEQKKTISKIVSKTVSKTDTTVLILKVAVALLLLGALYISVFHIPSESITSRVVLFSVGMAGLLGFDLFSLWKSPAWMSEKINSFKSWRVNKNLQEIGLSEKQDNYLIDWNTGEIQEKNNTLLPDNAIKEN